jgi:hypothetical protein
MTVPADPQRLAELGQTVLEAIVQAFVDAGVTPPTAQYRWGELPAVDCEQITVSFIRLYTGTEAANISQIGPTIEANTSFIAQFDVYVVRCVPIPDDSGKPPSATNQDAAGAELMTDAWVLGRGIINRKKQGDFADCDVVTIGQVEALAASGGFGGNVMTITVSV